MYAWERLDRGTLRLALNGMEADVWRVGRALDLPKGGARWTVNDSFVYVGSGHADSVDAACEAALAILEKGGSK